MDRGVTATVASELRGTQGLHKTDFGALVLTGNNNYTGATTVSDGVLQLGDGGTSGSIKGDVIVDSHVYGQGTLAIDRNNRTGVAGRDQRRRQGGAEWRRRDGLRRQQYVLWRTDR